MTPVEQYNKVQEIVEQSQDKEFLRRALLEMMDNTTWYLADIPALYEKVNN